MDATKKLKIIKARFIAPDTSHWITLAQDRLSANADRQETAKKFEQSLLRSGCVPLLCLHHIAELSNYEDQAIVNNQLRFLRSLPMVAWIAPSAGDVGLGSVLDILIAEVEAALSLPAATCTAIRDHAAQKLIKVGTGQEALAPILESQSLLQPIFRQQAERARELVAISRSKHLDNISRMKVLDLLNAPLRSLKEVDSQFDLLAARLAKDIKARGDEKIPNATAVAAKFYNEIRRAALARSESTNPILEILRLQDVDETDFGPKTTVGEIGELATFRRKLRVANKTIGASWHRLKASVHMDQIPSWVIQNTLTKYGQDFSRREGGELTDAYLACLAAYADVTFIDKRTKENFNRATRKSRNFASVVRRVEKASDYREIARHLEISIEG